MKRIFLVMAVAAVALFTTTSCTSKYAQGDVMPHQTPANVDTVSYAIGMYFGNVLQSLDLGETNLMEVRKGFYDVLNKKTTKFDDNEAQNQIGAHMMNRQTYVSSKNLEEGTAFLEANKEKEGVVELENGLQYKILQEGSGVKPTETDTVEVNYEGRLLNGTVFDSSYERGETAVFPLNRVIEGWKLGLQNVQEGGKIELYIPSELAYGTRGAGTIPANSTLIFTVELIKVSPVQWVKTAKEAKAEKEANE